MRYLRAPMLPHEVNETVLKDFFENPNTQEAATNFIGRIKNYERTGDEENLQYASNIALEVNFPYTHVMLEDEKTDSPSDMMLVTCLYLSELGLIPNYE